MLHIILINLFILFTIFVIIKQHDSIPTMEDVQNMMPSDIAKIFAKNIFFIILFFIYPSWLMANLTTATNKYIYFGLLILLLFNYTKPLFKIKIPTIIVNLLYVIKILLLSLLIIFSL